VPGIGNGLLPISASLANLEETIKQARPNIKRRINGTVWLDECIQAVQLAALSYHNMVHVERDKNVEQDKHVEHDNRKCEEYGKKLAHLLVELLKLSGFSSLLSSDGCNLCYATLSALSTICKTNGIPLLPLLFPSIHPPPLLLPLLYSSSRAFDRIR
jgi:hypothetical protein